MDCNSSVGNVLQSNLHNFQHQGLLFNVPHLYAHVQPVTNALFF